MQGVRHIEPALVAEPSVLDRATDCQLACFRYGPESASPLYPFLRLAEHWRPQNESGAAEPVREGIRVEPEPREHQRIFALLAEKARRRKDGNAAAACADPDIEEM